MKRFIAICSLFLLAACGGGSGSSANQASLLAPTSLAVQSTASTNTITWRPVYGATSYNLYWSTSPNINKNTANKVGNASTPYVHTGLVDTQKYYYAVTALKDNVESDLSSEIEICASKVIAIEANGNSFIALKSDGSVWGIDEWQIGSMSDVPPPNIPVQVPGLDSVVAVTVGSGNYHLGKPNHLALKSDGTLWAWGDNTYGQLGNGNTAPSTMPVKVNISDVVKIYSAGLTNFAIKRDGTVWAWGYNDGSLGYVGPTDDFKSTPVQIPNLSGIVDINSDDILSVNYAVKNDGTVWAWGWEGASVFGNPINAVPIMISEISNVKKILAPYWIATDGSVWSWSTNGNQSSIQSKGIYNVSSISRAMFTAVKTDGTVWAKEYDAAQTANLCKINVLNDAIATVSTLGTTFVLKRDGTVAYWNWRGQIPTVINPTIINGI